MAGELVEDPVLRQRYRFSREGDILRLELWADPGASVPDHYHPSLEERWEVVAGEATFRVDGEERRALPGERLVVPPGVRHLFRNTGSAEARFRVEVEPAMEIEEFLVGAADLNRRGGFTKSGVPKTPAALLRGAAFSRRYRDTTVLAFPPPLVQRVLFPPLARLARER
jgi:mannose-6-phosphate isomerase-like protein (cupin superfamily)